MLVECAAEKQEHRDEDGDPENADREVKAEAEAHRATLRSARRPVIPIDARRPLSAPPPRGNSQSQSRVNWFAMDHAQEYRDQAARLRAEARASSDPDEARASSDPDEIEMLNDVAAMFEQLAAFIAGRSPESGPSRH
jgi:hypothetical protein